VQLDLDSRPISTPGGGGKTVGHRPTGVAELQGFDDRFGRDRHDLSEGRYLRLTLCLAANAEVPVQIADYVAVGVILPLCTRGLTPS